MWRAAGRRGEPLGLRVRLVKRIPMQAGLGGGSSDAAAALRALSVLWRREDGRRRSPIGSELGADVPFFLEGGTALGLERGDLLFPARRPPGVVGGARAAVISASARRTHAAGGMRIATGRRGGRRSGGRRRSAGRRSAADNDLQAPVAARHPEIEPDRSRAPAGGRGVTRRCRAAVRPCLACSTGASARRPRRLTCRSSHHLVTRTRRASAFERGSAVRRESPVGRGRRLAAETAHRIKFRFAPRGFGHS